MITTAALALMLAGGSKAPTELSKRLEIPKAVASPDGKLTVSIRKLGDPSDSDDPAPNEVVLRSSRTGQERVIFGPNASAVSRGADNKGVIFSANHLVFSCDSSLLYVETAFPGTLDRIFIVNVTTRQARFFAWGDDVKVIRNGGFRGDLLMRVHTCYSAHPGCDYPVHVVRPDGKTLLVIPGTNGTDAQRVLDRWLTERDLHAS